MCKISPAAATQIDFRQRIVPLWRPRVNFNPISQDFTFVFRGETGDTCRLNVADDLAFAPVRLKIETGLGLCFR
jgi:hypothetical protein